MKEELRLVFHSAPEDAVALLEAWLVWARRCRIPSFVKLAKTITANKAGITATLIHRLSNARIEALNTTLRLICRRAYGFHSAQALIALATLTVGGLRPPLPAAHDPRKRQEIHLTFPERWFSLRAGVLKCGPALPARASQFGLPTDGCS